MGRVVVIGSNNVDLVTYVDRIPAGGETISAPRFAMGPGGKGANQAVAAARLGADVVLISRVGDDLFGAGTRQSLADSGIDISQVATVPGVTSGVATILVEPSGENRILIVAGANARLGPADIDAARPVIASADLILLQLEVPIETIYHAIETAHALGRRVLLNPAPARPDLDLALIATVSFLVPNETELALLTGRPTNDVAQIETAARGLIARGIGTVIVTMGSKGALLVTAEASRTFPALTVNPVDTTGAGDAFIGAFARFYAEAGDIDQAITAAIRYAADSVTKPGAQTSFATAAEFAAFCAELG